jgi:methylenetetrahydrofolate dehydrogenase (NADP+)/methenyltetrahydrofolate cyclohydrolase
MIVDGKQIAADIYAQLLKRRVQIIRPIKLGIVVASKDPVIESFVRIKSRQAKKLDVEIVRIDCKEDASTEEVVSAVRKLSASVDGIIVQLPLPPQVDIDEVLRAVPKDKDVDGINPAVSYKEQTVHAPVAGAIQHIFRQYNIQAEGKRVVIVGAGRLVGEPAARMLEDAGGLISTITREQGSLDELRQADIIVLGAGDPGFIKPEMIKDGVVLIDAGTSEAGGKIRGDADPACAEKAALFTPVPGGVGPIAVAMIFKNLFDLIDHIKS